MAKRDVERELEALSGTTDSGVLRKALRDKINLIAAKAAAIVARLKLRTLIPELLTAYDRHFRDAAKTDPQCWAKAALAKALKDLEWAESEPFVRGASYVQWEPVWGTEADSAGTLRATCLLALPFCTDLLRDEKLMCLMRGLGDSLATVRLEAARALEQIGGMEAALLLRLKARFGDIDLSVTGQVFESLLSVEREPAIPFILEAITQRGEPDKNCDLAEQAALVLGASRLPDSTEALIACFREVRSANLGEILLRSLSISRLDEALDFLVKLIVEGRQPEAVSALSALEMHSASQEVAARVRTAVAERDSEAVTAHWSRLFTAR